MARKHYNGVCWCLWCGEHVQQKWMHQHVWRHGAVASIGRCVLSSPSPWSMHQGYWEQHRYAAEPLVKQGKRRGQ